MCKVRRTCARCSDTWATDHVKKSQATGYAGLSSLNNHQLFDTIAVGSDFWLHCVESVQVEDGRKNTM